LIYELGLDDHQMENSVLWEYLASHGYIVAVMPSFGKSLEDRFVEYTKDGALNLYYDAEYVLKQMIGQSNVDSDRIGAIGHSFGGMVVNLLASRNKQIKALASLDGSINNPRAQEILEQLDITSSTVRVPLLNLYATAQRENDLSYVESLETPVYQFAYNKASHFDFQNWPLYAVVTNTPDPRGERRRTMEEGKAIILSVIKFSKHFFNFVFYDDAEGEAYLKGLSDDAKALRRLGEF
jgi:pimeloyl-ACP methyl ester carboxylesterase